MIDIAVTLLPEPLSPTTPSVSAAESDKLMSLIKRNGPSRRSRSTPSPTTSSTGGGCVMVAEPRRLGSAESTIYACTRVHG